MRPYMRPRDGEPAASPSTMRVPKQASPTTTNRTRDQTGMIRSHHDAGVAGYAPPVIYSRGQAADYLDVSPRTFDRLRAEAPLPCVVIGRRRKYLKRDLDAYIAEQRSV